MKLGLDFDNTIASYDALFYEQAVARQLISCSCVAEKRRIRDRVWQDFDDLAWQRLQGAVYGPLMGQALLNPGLFALLQGCKERQIPVCIVSHKTQFATFDDSHTDLRKAALAWMEGRGLFDPGKGSSLRPEDVYFEASRGEKVMRIKELGCTHFVDDLPEVLLEEAMGDGVSKVLYSQESGQEYPGLVRAGDWQEVAALLFAGEGL